MAGSNKRPTQKQPGDSRRSGRIDQNPLTFSRDPNNPNNPKNPDRQQEPWTEDDLLAEDDPMAADPPRTTTSSIRFQPPTGQRHGRTTREVREDMMRAAQQPTQDVPTRRTGNFPAPVQPARTGRAGTGRQLSPDLFSPSTPRTGRSLHWLVYVGIGMVVALTLWVSFSSILAWGTSKYNDIVYGYPRYFQTDQVVGHSDSAQHPSHFIALNLHGQVIVFELPSGNPSKSYEYIGPNLVANGDDLIPITLTFSDVNHDSKLDMIIHIEDREVIFCNNGTKFAQCSS